MSRDFSGIFRRVPARLRAELPAELHTFKWQAYSSQAKAWYGNKALHYEIWVRYSARVVELGLHFEADALTNARLIGAFGGRAKEILRALGPDMRIEQWDKGWTRVWEPIPLQDIDAAYGERITARFVDYIRALEPILRDELPNDVEWNVAPGRKPAPKRRAKGSASRASRSAR